MKKLSLDPDVLAVETFEPARPALERGTVHARETNASADPYFCCVTGGDPRCFTVVSACLTDCGCGGTGPTERVTECAGTCDD